MAFVFRDDVLAPKGAIIIEYSGPDPMSVYRKLNDMLQLTFEVKGKDIYETDFRWDIKSDPRAFFIKMHVKKGLDQFSSVTVFFKMQGFQPIDANKPGNIKIEISGFLETNYPTKGIGGIFLIPLMFIYHLAIYNRIRRRYLQYANERIRRINDTIRSMLNIPKE